MAPALSSFWSLVKSFQDWFALEESGTKSFEVFLQRKSSDGAQVTTFKSFLEEMRPQDGLVRVGDSWEEWLNDNHAQLDESPDFIKWVRQWTRLLPQHRQTEDFVLISLASKYPFDKWSSFEPYRSLAHYCGTNAVALGSKKEGNADDIRKIVSFLVPKLSRDDNSSKRPRDFFSVNATIPGDEPGQALGSVHSLLARQGFWGLLLRWARLGRRTHRNNFGRFSSRSLTVIVYLIVISTGVFLLTADPWKYFRDDFLIYWAGSLMITISTGLVSWRCWNGGRETLKAWRRGMRWSRLLRASQVGIVAENPSPPIEGASCGVALALSILLALDDADPVSAGQSPFWHQFFQQLRQCAPTLAVTGEARSDCKVGEVKSIDHKIEAALKHRKLTELITPGERDVIEAALREPKIVDLIEAAQKVGSWPRELVRKQSAEESVRDQSQAPESGQNFKLIPVPAAQAANKSRLLVRPCRSMANLCLTIGCLESKAPVAVASLVGQALLVVIAFLGAYNLWQITLYPVPEIDSSWSARGQGDVWEVGINTADPELFAAKFTSCYWANRPAEAFSAERRIPSRGQVAIKLDKLESAGAGCDFRDGSLEILRLRSFFWRELPPSLARRYPLWHLARGWKEDLEKTAALGSGGSGQLELTGSPSEQPK